MLLQSLHRALVALLRVERRLEPWFRPGLNRLAREPSAALLQYLINRRRPQENLGLAEERYSPDEEASLDSIIELMRQQMLGRFKPGHFERGGNTKTHGIVRAIVTVRADLPAHLQQGIFVSPRSYPAYVRFAGPGPDVPRDIDDVGFSSMSLKIMDVPGDKLLPDERFTQDFPAVCTPTFVTPDTRANVRLQAWSLRHMPLFYFLDPRETHLLDMLMQAWWNETQYNPLGQRHWSCVPYLLGEGQAMQYSFLPLSSVHTHIPGLPFGRVPPHYLHDNLTRTLADKAVDFDFLIQVQTDPQRMPIENAAVRWPEKLSPFLPAARIHIPQQTLDPEEQRALANSLSINPWHGLPAHRPLGNQNRARRRLYLELSRLRQQMNQSPHCEPDASAWFPVTTAAASAPTAPGASGAPAAAGTRPSRPCEEPGAA